MSGEEIWAKGLLAPRARRTGSDIDWAMLAEKAIVRGSR